MRALVLKSYLPMELQHLLNDHHPAQIKTVTIRVPVHWRLVIFMVL
jgi:hypothetical protein